MDWKAIHNPISNDPSSTADTSQEMSESTQILYAKLKVLHSQGKIFYSFRSIAINFRTHIALDAIIQKDKLY